MGYLAACNRGAIAVLCSLLVCTLPCKSIAMCNSQMANLDFFDLFTQQVERENVNLPPEAPRMEGMDLRKPAFEFNGTGMQYNNSQAVGLLRNISCNTKQLTIYASMFFKGSDRGGPLVVLSQDNFPSSKPPLLGLFVEPASNQFILMYPHSNLARVEKFNHMIPRGKWMRLAVTISGSVLVVHINCNEVLRRTIAVPDYCMGSDNIIASVGQSLNPTEFGTGLTGSLQNIGIAFGMNGLDKQCTQVTGTEICPTCGEFLATLNRVYQLTEQVKQLQSQLRSPQGSDVPTQPSSIGATMCPTETTNENRNCLIDGVSREDKSFTVNRAGKICFCDNGNARCKIRSEIPTIPPATANEGTRNADQAQSSTNTQPTTAPRTCKVNGGTVTLRQGEKFFLPQNNMCQEMYCREVYGELSPNTVNHDCLSRDRSCSKNFTALERNISICCDQCTACDFSTCPAHSTCQDQGGSTFTCPCNTGFEISMNRTCVDRDECKLGHQSGGHNCPAHSTCVNTIGSFECRCMDGFRKTTNGLCVDIDECAENSHTCPVHSVCVNTQSGYTCNCSTGYSKDGSQCAPVCESGCFNGGRCIRPNTCMCLPGFTGTSCEMDINECNETRLNSCHVRGTCVNTFGGHFCRCNNGYQHKERACADVNECTLGIHNCIPEATCENNYGSFSCICPDGNRCSGACKKDNQIMANRETRLFGHNNCTKCTCNDGDVSCKPVECDCSDANVSRTCCPQCSKRNVCVVGDTVVTVGTELPDPQDACIKRRCMPSGMLAVVNQRQSCSSLSCDTSEQYVPSGACCPVCQFPRCSAQNNGTTIKLANGCKSCTCKYINSQGKEWMCTNTVQCPPMANCPSSQIVYLKGQCCPVCQRTILSKTPCNSS